MSQAKVEADTAIALIKDEIARVEEKCVVCDAEFIHDGRSSVKERRADEAAP